MGYYQDKHFQSLEHNTQEEMLLIDDNEDNINTVTLEELPYNLKIVVQDFSNCRTDEWGNLVASDEESDYEKSDAEDDNMSCNFCVKEFSCATNLKRHVENIHNTRKRKKASQKSEIPAKVQNLGGGSFVCTVCKKVCRDNYNLKRLMESHK